MSGPKVVRIVTREEIEAICRRNIADADAAAATLLTTAARHLDDTGKVQADALRRIEGLRELLQSERWLELQKQAPLIVAYFVSEGERIRAEARAAAEERRGRRRRLVEGGHGMIAALEAQGRPVPASLRSSLERAGMSSDADLGELQSALNEGLRQLVSMGRASSGCGGTQRELADRLAAGETQSSLSEWLAARSARETSPSDARLDALLAELDVLEDETTAASFEARASAILTERNAGRRALLTDSLILEVSDALRAQRTRDDVKHRVREAIARLDAIEAPSLLPLRKRLSRALASLDLAESEKLLAESNEALSVAVAELAATARRRAILGGLASLGYEVRETLATALARDGRIVIRKPDVQDYGVELACPADGTRMQVRLVGADQPAAPRTATRDRDQEVIWCSEFTSLRELVARSGSELVVERALEPGAQVVKTVQLPSDVQDTNEAFRNSAARTLR